MPTKSPLSVIRPDERFQVFIDGPNLHSSTRGLRFDMDYKKMHDLFNSVGKCQRIGYYTGVLERGPDEEQPMRRLLDYLDYNGFNVVTKIAMEYFDEVSGETTIKGNMDVELAVDMLECRNVDHIVLFSGDGDFYPVVEALKRRGTRVTVVSTIRTKPAMVNDDLRRAADNFIDLKDLEPIMARPPQEEEQRRYA